ncbi:hypothetical protein ACHAPD_004450 [Fusarium lateritium]
MSPAECYPLLSELVPGEDRMLESGEDVKAFEHTLGRFPSFRRVTISTKAHERLFMPMYETPMIRSFPYGFVYPVPRCRWETRTSAFLWKDEQLETNLEYTIDRRGVCSALRILARHGRHNVSEFIIEDPVAEAPHIPTPFDDQGHTLTDSLSLIQRPGFRKLDLYANNLSSWYETLEKAKNLKSLRISNWKSPHYSTEVAFVWEPERTNAYKIGRQDLNIVITVVAPLASLRSLELYCVIFLNEDRFEDETYMYCSLNPHNFLNELRGTEWRSRSLRPKVTIQLADDGWAYGKTLKLDSDIDDFLYGDGENPFVPSKMEMDDS